MSEQASAMPRIGQVMGMLPHRYPFLLIDRVLDYRPGESIKVLKNVTINEPFFQGHFPEKPVMPGVLIMEALAQAGGVYVSLTLGDALKGKLFMFTGMDKVRFRRPVMPGDQLVLECTDIRNKFKIWKMQGHALVDGDVVAEAVLSAAIADRGEV